MVTDNHNDVIDCIKNMVTLARDGKIVSLDFWICESHVQLAVLEMFKGGEPVFGAIAHDELEELCNELRALCNELGVLDDNNEAMRGPVSSALLMMLVEMLVKWIVEQANSGELARILLELIEKLRPSD